MNFYKSIVLFISIILITTSYALAATDGSVGATSTGTSTISLTIPKLIRARSFSDFSLGTYSGTGDLNANDDLNISTNYTGTYRVTATGSGAASAFTITNGTQTIAYNVFYNDATGITGRVAATTGTPITAQSGALKPLSTATLNANLSIQLLETNIQAVDNGAYTGVVTLVFQPE